MQDSTTFIEPLWILAAVFVASAAVAWLVVGRLVERAAMRRRFVQLAAAPQPATQSGSPPGWVPSLDRVAIPAAVLAMPTDPVDVSELRKSLIRAGWRGSDALTRFIFARVALTVFLPAAACLAWLSIPVLRQWVVGAPAIAFALLAAGAAGYFAPVVLCRVRIARRQQALFEAFPDALDLMLICVESGLALDASLQRVASEIRLRSPVLADELSLLAAEVRAGVPREQAMRKLAERTGLPEVESFATLIIQADRFGTSVGAALRVQADSLRATRRLRAEERAAKVPVKLLFPLVFCIFPVLFTVLLGPAAIRVWRVLVPALQSAG